MRCPAKNIFFLDLVQCTVLRNYYCYTKVCKGENRDRYFKFAYSNNKNHDRHIIITIPEYLVDFEQTYEAVDSSGPDKVAFHTIIVTLQTELGKCHRSFFIYLRICILYSITCEQCKTEYWKTSGKWKICCNVFCYVVNY